LYGIAYGWCDIGTTAPHIFLPFISSAFVSTESMPRVVRAFAENQPVTSIVESIHALLSGQSKALLARMFQGGYPVPEGFVVLPLLPS